MSPRLAHLGNHSHGRPCVVCGGPMVNKRGDATTCSDACRQTLSRRSTPLAAGSLPAMALIRELRPDLYERLRTTVHDRQAMDEARQVYREAVATEVHEVHEGPPTLAQFMAANR